MIKTKNYVMIYNNKRKIETENRIQIYRKKNNNIIKFILDLLNKYYNGTNIHYKNFYEFKLYFKSQLKEYITKNKYNDLFDIADRSLSFNQSINQIYSNVLRFIHNEFNEEKMYNRIIENIANIVVSIEANDEIEGGSNNKIIINKKRLKTIKKYKYKKNKTGKRKNGKKGKRNNNTPKLMNAKKSNKKMTISQILINNLKK